MVEREAPTTFKSVLRIRNLTKKERDDRVILEALSDTAVALHPSNTELLSPHSIDTVQTGQDVEFTFDKVLENSSQEAVYCSIGQPMAYSAMESLESDRKTTHLILANGLPDSGKSYTVMGSPHARLSHSDGLVPRILNCMFLQSKHSVKKSKGSFCVQIKILNIIQNQHDCQIMDLLQQPPKQNSGAVDAIGNFANSILHSGLSKSNYSQLKDPVRIQQDPITSECKVINAITKQCVTIEQARDIIRNAVSRKQSKKVQTHTFFELQPTLISKSGRVVKSGERIVLLDMAGRDYRSHNVASRTSDSYHKDDAHSAIMHCLKAIRDNQENKDHGKYDKLRNVPFLQHKTTMLLESLFSNKKTSETEVTLLLTVSPGATNYSEKKLMLNEFVHLHRPSMRYKSKTGVDNTYKNSKKNEKPTNRVFETKNVSPHDDEGTMFWDSRDEESAFASDLLDGYIKPKKVEREASMTYSDSTEGRLGDTLSPLPPPVAPGFREVLPATAPYEQSHIAKRTPPPVSTYDDYDSTLAPPSSLSGRSNATPVAEIVVSEKKPSPRFNMETVKKVVHATKKKGRKVIERMTVTTISGDASLQKRISELEKHNEFLLDQVESLKEENKKLSISLRKYKKKTKRRERKLSEMTELSGTTSVNKNSAKRVVSDDISPVSQQENRKPALGNLESSPASKASLSPPAKASSDCGWTAPGDMFGSSFFRHMNTMNSKRWLGEDETQPSSSKSVDSPPPPASPSSFNYGYDESSFTDTDHKEEDTQPAMYDDVLQHMAMMNNLG